MKSLRGLARFLIVPLLLLALHTAPLHGMVDDAQSYALEAAEPYIKDGFTLRYDFQNGVIGEKDEPLIVKQQLFKGNEYWFWLAADAEDARLSINAYDEDGNLVEAESWQHKHFAAVRVAPSKTGTYLLVIKLIKAPKGSNKVNWAVAYGYR